MVNNDAYRALRNGVRWALDYYATREKLRQSPKIPPKANEPPSKTLERVGDVLEDYKKVIPHEARREISARLEDAVRATETEAQRTLAQVELLAPLATAGMAALAYEHEINQQYRLLEELILRIKKVGQSDEAVARLGEHLGHWLSRAKASRALFAPLTDIESRESRARYKAQKILSALVGRIGPLARGIPIDTADIDPDLRLPVGTLAAWNAVFQNVLFNAINALLDSEERFIHIGSGAAGARRMLWIQDTGVGVDLEDGNSLFQPFERRLEISPARRQLGLGGTGLGLTIVKMLAEQAGCKVAFVQPSKGYNTAFELSWKERL